jgi:hypothetical protein
MSKHIGKSTAASIRRSAEGIATKWFSSVSANGCVQPARTNRSLATQDMFECSVATLGSLVFCSGERATVAPQPLSQVYRAHLRAANLSAHPRRPMLAKIVGCVLTTLDRLAE